MSSRSRTRETSTQSRYSTSMHSKTIKINWSHWTEWSACLGQCDQQGIKRRQRKCNGPQGSCVNSVKDMQERPWMQIIPCQRICTVTFSTEQRTTQQMTTTKATTLMITPDTTTKKLSVTPHISKAEILNSWEEWGSWSFCLGRCGQKGMKRRTRSCSGNPKSCTSKDHFTQGQTPWVQLIPCKPKCPGVLTSTRATTLSIFTSKVILTTMVEEIEGEEEEREEEEIEEDHETTTAQMTTEFFAERWTEEQGKIESVEMMLDFQGFQNEEMEDEESEEMTTKSEKKDYLNQKKLPPNRVVRRKVSGWTEWTDWTACSRTCGGGIQWRERACQRNCPLNKSTGNILSYHQEPKSCAMILCPDGQTSRWGAWSVWGACSKSCGQGFMRRHLTCVAGPCKNESTKTYPTQKMPCTVQRFCNYWSEWNDWSDCSVECGGGKRNRRRPCFNGTPGLQGCPGSQFDEEVCNTWRCHSQQNKYKPINEYGMPLTGNGFLLNPFNQECLDYHNFFRAIHRLPELAWNTRLAESATNWAEELVKRAKLGPNMKKIPKKTKNWPHSEQNSPWRDINIGENIAWDLTENGSPCSESVYRWYAEIFYFNPKNPTKGRRGKDPVGHLTALLWPDTTEMGCGTVELLIPQAGYRVISENLFI